MDAALKFFTPFHACPSSFARYLPREQKQATAEYH
jgi:hypothetical protein